MIYSIGHGNRSWPDFLDILVSKNCKFLIDVRSFPVSKFNPSFNKDQLDEQCRISGVKYVFMGDALGGRPADRSLYDKEGHADYQLIEKSPQYTAGISRLEKAASIAENTFIMCSELNPCDCHRSKLIGKSLEELGISIRHIDKNGNETSQAQVINKIDHGQADLFGDSAATTKSRGKYR